MWRDPLFSTLSRERSVSRALALKQKQVTALCKGAAAAGCIAEVKIGDVVIRLVPAANSQSGRPIDEEEDIRL
jgi:hypothetical protein